jgi:hypothetical protein
MEDYTNLSQFTDKWNDFAEAIAAGHILQMQEEIDAVRQNLNMIKDRNEKARKNKLLDVQTKYLSRISC